MILLFAVDRDWNIGKDNDLLFKITEDQQMFKKRTTGNINLMGKNTYESLPGKEGLPNRINIVVTEEEDREDTDSLFFVNSLDEAYDLIDKMLEEEDRDLYCIGGADLASQVLDKCEGAMITKIDKVFDADIRMENLDELEDWEIVEESETRHDDKTGLDYKYVKYVKNKITRS